MSAPGGRGRPAPPRRWHGPLRSRRVSWSASASSSHRNIERAPRAYVVSRQALGREPDLKQASWRVVVVTLGVADPGGGTHRPHVARTDCSDGSLVVAARDGFVGDVGGHLNGCVVMKLRT